MAGKKQETRLETMEKELDEVKMGLQSEHESLREEMHQKLEGVKGELKEELNRRFEQMMQAISSLNVRSEISQQKVTKAPEGETSVTGLLKGKGIGGEAEDHIWKESELEGEAEKGVEYDPNVRIGSEGRFSRVGFDPVHGLAGRGLRVGFDPIPRVEINERSGGRGVRESERYRWEDRRREIRDRRNERGVDTLRITPEDWNGYGREEGHRREDRWRRGYPEEEQRPPD